MTFVAALVVSVAAGAWLSTSACAQTQSPPASAQANPQQASPQRANDSIRTDPEADALSPWTEERMRNATEMKPAVIDLPALRQLPPPEPVPPPMTPPIPPTQGRYADPADGPDGKLLPSQRAGDPASYPLRWAGRLFAQMQQLDGRWNDISCSAQFIAPNMILTAAHCVRKDIGGTWGRNFQFALQYNRGRYSQIYQPACIGTTPDAFEQRPGDPSWRARDYALLLTDRPSRTGHFGWQLDWRGAYPEATAIGYPAAIDRGDVIQMVSGPLFFLKELSGMVIMREATTRFSNGASGGALVGNFRTDGGSTGNRVISVLSSRNETAPLLLGPYFDDGFRALYDYVARGCR